MAEETKQTKERPIFFMLIRLVMIYTAATCFFRGWEFWQNENYLESAIWFLLSFAQVGQILGWARHESKVVRMTVWIPLILVLIMWIVSKF